VTTETLPGTPDARPDVTRKKGYQGLTLYIADLPQPQTHDCGVQVQWRFFIPFAKSESVFYNLCVMVEHISAPWRGEFIRGPKEKGCVFCRLVGEAKDRGNLIIHRGEHCFVVFNRYPYTSGHLMIVPNRHVAKIETLPANVLSEMMFLAQVTVKALKSEFSPQGFNLGMNLGRSAGAGIAGHLHLHVVPRWAGDSNFMATTGDVRVISITQDDVYQVLHKHFQKL
jgi:ATP adenylyltransferase